MMAFVQEFSADMYEKYQPDSLRWGYVIPHDIIWIPFGAVMVEKSTGACNNLTLRVPSPFLESEQLYMARFLHNGYKQLLS